MQCGGSHGEFCDSVPKVSQTVVSALAGSNLWFSLRPAIAASRSDSGYRNRVLLARKEKPLFKVTG